ncbi:unnamed protein product [Gordionus sp. m RMFG-2023]
MNGSTGFYEKLLVDIEFISRDLLVASVNIEGIIYRGALLKTISQNFSSYKFDEYNVDINLSSNKLESFDKPSIVDTKTMVSCTIVESSHIDQLQKKIPNEVKVCKSLMSPDLYIMNPTKSTMTVYNNNYADDTLAINQDYIGLLDILEPFVVDEGQELCNDNQELFDVDKLIEGEYSNQEPLDPLPTLFTHNFNTTNLISSQNNIDCKYNSFVTDHIQRDENDINFSIPLNSNESLQNILKLNESQDILNHSYHPFSNLNFKEKNESKIIFAPSSCFISTINNKVSSLSLHDSKISDILPTTFNTYNYVNTNAISSHTLKDSMNDNPSSSLLANSSSIIINEPSNTVPICDLEANYHQNITPQNCLPNDSNNIKKIPKGCFTDLSPATLFRCTYYRNPAIIADYYHTTPLTPAILNDKGKDQMEISCNSEISNKTHFTTDQYNNIKSKLNNIDKFQVMTQPHATYYGRDCIWPWPLPTKAQVIRNAKRFSKSRRYICIKCKSKNENNLDVQGDKISVNINKFIETDVNNVDCKVEEKVDISNSNENGKDRIDVCSSPIKYTRPLTRSHLLATAQNIPGSTSRKDYHFRLSSDKTNHLSNIKSNLSSSILMASKRVASSMSKRKNNHEIKFKSTFNNPMVPRHSYYTICTPNLSANGNDLIGRPWGEIPIPKLKLKLKTISAISSNITKPSIVASNIPPPPKYLQSNENGMTKKGAGLKMIFSLKDIPSNKLTTQHNHHPKNQEAHILVDKKKRSDEHPTSYDDGNDNKISDQLNNDKNIVHIHNVEKNEEPLELKMSDHRKSKRRGKKKRRKNKHIKPSTILREDSIKNSAVLTCPIVCLPVPDPESNDNPGGLVTNDQLSHDVSNVALTQQINDTHSMDEEEIEKPLVIDLPESDTIYNDIHITENNPDNSNYPDYNERRSSVIITNKNHCESVKSPNQIRYSKRKRTSTLPRDLTDKTSRNHDIKFFHNLGKPDSPHFHDKDSKFKMSNEILHSPVESGDSEFRPNDVILPANEQINLSETRSNSLVCPKLPTHSLNVGDIVWGKIQGYPWWPAKILEFRSKIPEIRAKNLDLCTPPEENNENNTVTKCFVSWFGEAEPRSVSEVLPKDVVPFAQFYSRYYRINKNGGDGKKFHGPASFKEALKQATADDSRKKNLCK